MLFYFYFFCYFLTQDYHATRNSMPLVDQQQSYTLLSLIESDGQTHVTFQRAIQSCDEQDFHITVSSTSPQVHQLNQREQIQIVLLFFLC